MEVGTCKYCLSERPLVESHLIPRALYGKCGVNGQLIVLSSKEVKYSSVQLKKPLLCADCDNSLNRDGEHWALSQLAEKHGRFPLYELLCAVPPDRVETDVTTYATFRNPDVDVEKLTHFAVAIFWKAAVYSWRPNKVGNLIELGPYADQLRGFLRKEGPFSKHVALTVFVHKPPVMHISFGPPYLSDSSGFRSYALYVPGILFVLSVGKQLGDTKKDCFYSNPTHPVFVCEFSEPLQSVLQQLTSGARISQRVRETWSRAGNVSG